jgi:DNA-binding MarR family transcriptional regulator
MAADERPEVADEPETVFEDHMVLLVRSLGLHKPDQTPCGQPVSVGEAHALLEIAREPGITQNGLAARLKLEKSTVSRIVGQLATRGWVSRDRDTSDARFVLLRLTQRGISANANIAASRSAKFRRIFDAIPAERRAAIVESLGLLLEITHDV